MDTNRRAGLDELRATVGRMADTLVHRGPDDSGTWVDPEAGIALGHRRLSIVDLSAQGHQPMASACERYYITYNGEIYNFKSVRRELEDEGWRFRGHCDTEVMLAAISSYGLEAALQKFNGMFAFALWDRRERVLHLIRDRLGEKPLYYGWSGSLFLFGSELKALRAHPGVRLEIDPEALSLYLRYGYIPAPHSIYRGIYKLPAAHRVTVAADRTDARPVAYWRAQDVAERGVRDPFTGSDRDAEDELDALLRDAVAMRMQADVPLGAFLSGGVDSSTVVALMQSQSTVPIKTFTIGFNEPAFDEAVHAKAVAKHIGADHTELYVTPREAMEVIPALPILYDEPFSDSSQVPTYLISKLARTAVTVSLSGDGGDELFGGYSRYLRTQRIWNAVSAVPSGLKAGASRAVGALRTTRSQSLVPAQLRVSLDRKLERLATCVANTDPDCVYTDVVSCWPAPSAVVLNAVEPRTLPTTVNGNLKLDHILDRMMYLDTVTYLPEDILVKVDRAAMGVSLESRIPLLDHRVVEFAWRLPRSMKLKGQTGKRLLRQVLYRYVPKELIERPKKGFGVPVGSWIRGPLRDWAEGLLNPRKIEAQGYFDSAIVRQTWDQHLSRAANWQDRLWNIIVFQAWLETQ